MSSQSSVAYPRRDAASVAAQALDSPQEGDHYRLACPAHKGSSLDLDLVVWHLPTGEIGAHCFLCRAPYTELVQALGLPEPPPDLHIVCPLSGCKAEADTLDAIYQHPDGRLGGQHRRDYAAHEECFKTSKDPGNPCPKQGTQHKHPWICPSGSTTRGFHLRTWGEDAPDSVLLVVEGESAAQAAQRLDLVGYTPVSYRGGSGMAKSADYSLVAGRVVVIWPDNDEPGRKAAEDVGRRCLQSGATAIRIIDVSGLAEGDDAADVDKQKAETLLEAARPFETEKGELANRSQNKERYGVSSRTELRAAARLLTDFADHLLVAFAPDGTSATYIDTGVGVWRPDYGKVQCLFAQSVKLYQKAALSDGADSSEDDGGLGSGWGAFVKWCAQQETSARFDGVLRSVAGAVAWLEEQGRVPVALTRCNLIDLDSQTQYMGAPNGVVDLKTASLLTGAPARRTLTTRTVSEPYVPSEHPDVDKLLSHLPTKDREWLLSAFGHALHGEPNERVYYLLGEGGGEGKSTVLGAVRAALGEYGGVMLDGALSRQRSTSAGLTPELEVFKRARVVVKSENLSGQLDEERLKALSGGDPYAHRNLHENVSLQTRVVGTMFFAVNELPRMKLEDKALGRRLKILRYPAPKTVDVGLRKRLRDGPQQRQAVTALLATYSAANKEPPADIPSVEEALAEAQDEARGEAGDWIEQNLKHQPDNDSPLFASDIWDKVKAAEGGPKPDVVWGYSKRRFWKLLREILPVGNQTVLRVGPRRARGYRPPCVVGR